MANETTEAPEGRPPHQSLIDEFMELDKECQELIEKFTTGKIIYDCIPNDGAQNYEELFGKMVAKFLAAQEYAKQLIEKRNAKLQEAGAAMRATVMANESIIRGPDGKSSVQKYGPFEVSSKTSRGFDWNVLQQEVQKLGLFKRLSELKFIDKNTGAEEPAVRLETKVNYEAVKNWLREQNLEEVLQTAYEEEEGTPAVTGPKPIGWLGDVDQKAKGKKGK
jgi:hypothetical protein